MPPLSTELVLYAGAVGTLGGELWASCVCAVGSPLWYSPNDPTPKFPRGEIEKFCCVVPNRILVWHLGCVIPCHGFLKLSSRNLGPNILTNSLRN